MTTHELKCWPEFFEAILSNTKRHDLRRNDDRNFQVGDVLHLREYDPLREEYTIREMGVVVTYITNSTVPCALSNGALHPDYCILSIALRWINLYGYPDTRYNF